MKLNEFIANLLTLVETAPEMAELQVLYSVEESNIVKRVLDSPTLVHAVIYKDNTIDLVATVDTSIPYNAILIN